MATSNYGTGSVSTNIGNWTVVDKTSSDPAWVIPTGASILNVLIIGGGGGGGSGAFDESSVSTTEAQGGGGGGGGAALFLKNLDVSFMRKYGLTIPIVVGAGGAGGVGAASSVGQAGVAGANGTASSFGPFSAAGGFGGAGGLQANATQMAVALGGSTVTTSGTRMLVASPATTAQLSDFLLMNSIPGMAVSEYISFTGGSGSAASAINLSTTNTIVYATNATYPTTSAFSVTSFSFDAIFNAGSTGAGTFVSRTSTAGAGSSAGFCGGGGSGGNAYQNDTNSTSNALYAVSFPTAGVWGGGGGAGGIESSQSGQGAGGAGAPNSGGGGGGGGGSDNGTRDGTTVPTNNGGAGGSGRVIIWYRT